VDEKKSGSPLETKLLVVADDFGFCPEVNRAVCALHRAGRLSGASLLVNTPHFKTAINMAKKAKLAVGLHLNITQGKPVLPPSSLKSLVNKDGYFLGKSKLLLKAVAGLLSPAELEAEIKAQTDRISATGLRVSFANGHQNAHLYPRIFPLFLKVIRKQGIKYHRPVEDLALTDISSIANKPHRKAVLYLLGKYCRLNLAEKHRPGLGAGFSLTLKDCRGLTELEAFLEKQHADVMEISSHPAYPITGPTCFDTYLRDQRVKEFKLLMQPDFEPMMQRLNYRLINFNQL